MPDSYESYTKHVFFASSHQSTIDILNGPSQSQLAGVGILLAFAGVWLMSRRDGQPATDGFATLGLAAAAALVGARVWALVEWRLAARDAQWIWDPFEPAGYSSSGAIIAVAVVVLAARVIFGRDPFARLIDVVAPAGFVALALSRLGCLFEGCDIGTPATFGVSYVSGGPVVHAFGAYVAVPTLLAAAVLSFTRWRPGARAAAIACAYAAVRFVAEFFRAGAPPPNLGQGVAVGIVAGVALWWWIDRRGAGHPTG